MAGIESKEYALLGDAPVLAAGREDYLAFSPTAYVLACRAGSLSYRGGEASHD